MAGFSYVPSDVADRRLGPLPEDRELTAAKRDALLFARELGAARAGHPIDTGWAFGILAGLAEEKLGVVGWTLEGEDNTAAARVVADAARDALAAVRQNISLAEADRMGAPF